MPSANVTRSYEDTRKQNSILKVAEVSLREIRKFCLCTLSKNIYL